MKTQPKKAPLEKNHFHHDFRKKGKVTRKQHLGYIKWLKEQPLQCIECHTMQFTELHHVNPQDNRTCVCFCAFCHRGQEMEGRKINIDDVENKPKNGIIYVTKGFYYHRGTRSNEFKEKWPDHILLAIAKRLYDEYKSQINS